MPAAPQAGDTSGTPASAGPRGAQNGEWPTYHGDLYATQYAPLDQITKDNVSKLAVAWNWDSPDNAIVAADRKYQPWGFKSTPLMIGGKLYVNTSLGHVASIDAATGKTLWVFDSKSREAGRPTNLGFNSRGVGYWTDGKEERVFHPSGDAMLWAIDAKTGKAIEGFGAAGKVDVVGDAAPRQEPQLGHADVVAAGGRRRGDRGLVDLRRSRRAPRCRAATCRRSTSAPASGDGRSTTRR